MSLVDVFGPSEIRGLKLRMIVEKLGKRILLLSALSCCEPTMKDIADACAKKKLERKNPHAGKYVGKNKKPPLPVISVSTYGAEIAKANEELNKTNPTWQSFDITFLNKILSLIEADFPDFLNNEVRGIKNKRNQVMHTEAFSSETEFEDEFKELAHLFSKSLDEAERIGTSLLSSVTNQVKKTEISTSLQEIQTLKNNIINEMDKIKFEKIDETLTNVEEYLVVIGHEEIKSSFNNLVYMNPVFFLIGKKFTFHVERFYTQPEFTMKESGSYANLDSILDLIEYTEHNLLIEGQAGVGKTTFMRLLMAKKASGDRFQNLMLIPYECRKKNFSSLSKVIADILPKASHKFPEDKLIRAVLSFKPIFMIDGLDERSEDSDAVINEIISHVTKGEARFIATSRPEAVETFLHEIDDNYQYIELNGIPKDSLSDIVGLYYDIFSETQDPKILQGKKQVKNAVIKMWEHFKDQIRLPLILCLITYLLVNKEKNIQQCESITSLYMSIFESLFKKLKTRLMDKDGGSFNQRRFRMEVKKFENQLCNFSLEALKNNKFVLSFDDSCDLVDGLSESFGDEVLSSMFVCKGYVTITGLEMTSYTYPHKSFQEFLAAKEVSKMVANKDITNLAEVLEKDHLRNKSFIFFTVGLLAQDRNLTAGLCEEIASILQLKYIHNPFHKEKIAGILREANKEVQMADALSSNFRELEINSDFDDFRLYNLILESACSALEYINLDITSKNETIMSTMRLLRGKDTKVDLSFPYDKTSEEFGAEDLIKEIIDGKCLLERLSGRLGTKGAKQLPKTIGYLKLFVSEEDEAQAIRWLNEESGLFHSHSSKSEDEHLKSLNFKISPSCNVDLLPRRLQWPLNSLKITVMNSDEQGIKRVLQVVEMLPKPCDCSNFRPAIRFRLEWSSATFGDLDTFLQSIKKHPNVGDIQSNSTNLSEEEWSRLLGIRYVVNATKLKERFSSEDIARLPQDNNELVLWILDSVHADALHCLLKRLAGGTAKLNPIKINILGLMITPTCDPSLLPDRLPTGKDYLNLVLKDTDGEKDFEWILQIMDRLPRVPNDKDARTGILRTWLNEISLPISKWKELLERLRVNKIKTFIFTNFSGLSQDEMDSLIMQYEPFNIYFILWP